MIFLQMPVRRGIINYTKQQGLTVRTIQRLITYVMPYYRRAAVAYTCLLFSTLLGLASPWILKEVLDRGLTAMESSFIVFAGLTIIAISVMKAGFSFGYQYLTEWLAQRVAYDLRNQLYDHLQRLPFSFHDQAQTGQLMSRATTDIDAIRQFVASTPQDLGATAILVVAITIITVSLDPVLAILGFLPLPMILLITIRFGHVIRPLFARLHQQHALMSAVLQENLSGVRVVRAFARERYEAEKFDRENRRVLERNLAATRTWSFDFPMMSFLMTLSTAIILLYGGGAVIAGKMSIGTVVAFTNYMTMLGWPIRRLGWVVNMLARAVAAAERIFELLDTHSDISDRPGAHVLTTVEGHVRFEHVTFTYGDRIVLNDVSIEARPGQVIALVGLTGSGKSTAVSLIPRFYDVTAGRITIDGYDVRQITLQSLRSHIGVVLQETFLFSATIRDNIAYGQRNAPLDKIVAAAKAAHAHDFIMSFPDGYDTWVGERGVTLSGGQRQRIAIARALLINPRILILDDSTSSVDTETEYLIQEALARLMQGRTTFVIAQRLTTVLRADLIIVLDNGRVVEQGYHHELLTRGRLYRRIYDLQLRDQEQAATDLLRTARGTMYE